MTLYWLQAQAWARHPLFRICHAKGLDPDIPCFVQCLCAVRPAVRLPYFFYTQATAVRGPLGQLLAEVPAPPFNDFIFINMYWMSIACALVLGVCFFRPYFARLRCGFCWWLGLAHSAHTVCARLTCTRGKRGDRAGDGVAETCWYRRAVVE